MLKYLLEVRNRILLIFLTFLTLCITCYSYKEVLLFYLMRLGVDHTGVASSRFMFTDVAEVFYVYLNLSIFISVQVTIVYSFYHTITFLVPAFFYTEYKKIALILKVCPVIWVVSSILADQVVIPSTWNFFLSFQNLDCFTSLNFEAKLSEYLNYYISIYYLCVVYLQTLALLLLLLVTYAGTNFQHIKRFRKMYYYLFVLLSTILSPPDIISQLVISTATVTIFEFLVFLLIFDTHLTK